MRLKSNRGMAGRRDAQRRPSGSDWLAQGRRHGAIVQAIEAGLFVLMFAGSVLAAGGLLAGAIGSNESVRDAPRYCSRLAASPTAPSYESARPSA